MYLATTAMQRTCGTTVGKTSHCFYISEASTPEKEIKIEQTIPLEREKK